MTMITVCELVLGRVNPITVCISKARGTTGWTVCLGRLKELVVLCVHIRKNSWGAQMNKRGTQTIE